MLGGFILCLFKPHKWDGCKCVTCGKTHDWDHDWIHCQVGEYFYKEHDLSKDCEKCSRCGKMAKDDLRCRRCGKTTTSFYVHYKHNWDGCKCRMCSKTRDEEHNWSKDCEKCSRCGKGRSNSHNWTGCKCSTCGKTRDESHDWIGCKCSKCSKKRDEEHDWSLDCEKCSRCGKGRSSSHNWTGCKCSTCGMTRDEGHELVNCKCSRCKKEVHRWEGWKCLSCGFDRVESLKKRIMEAQSGLCSLGTYKHSTFEEALQYALEPTAMKFMTPKEREARTTFLKLCRDLIPLDETMATFQGYLDRSSIEIDAPEGRSMLPKHLRRMTLTSRELARLDLLDHLT